MREVGSKACSNLQRPGASTFEVPYVLCCGSRVRAEQDRGKYEAWAWRRYPLFDSAWKDRYTPSLFAVELCTGTGLPREQKGITSFSRSRFLIGHY